MKTIISPSYLQEDIYHERAKNNGGFLSDVKAISLPTLCRDDDPITSTDLLFEATHLLQSHQDRYPIYREMFQYTAFVQELLSFVRLLILFHIDAKQLPQDSLDEVELSNIIDDLMSLSFSEWQIRDKAPEIVEQLLVDQDVEVYDIYEPNPFYARLLKQLASKKIDETNKVVQTTRLYRSATVRQEIESCAQMIIERQESSTVVLSDYTNAYPVLQQVFARYGIPFKALSHRVLTRMSAIMSSLLTLSYQPTPEHLINALHQGAFPIELPSTLIDYLEQTLVDLREPILDVQQIKDVYFPHDLSHLQHAQEQFSPYLEQLITYLSPILTAQSPQEKVRAAYDVFAMSPYLESPSELDAAMGIRSTINESLNHLQSDDDLAMLIQLIDQSTAKSEDDSFDSLVRVTDLTHPLPPTETLYVLGVSASQFPGFPTRSGLFDEEYVEKIEAFPSTKERHENYMSHLDWIYHNSTNLFFSCPSSDYQGREIQLSFEIESYMSKLGIKAQSWPLDVLAPTKTTPQTLAPETAERLFFKNGVVTGSISRIERWFNCPYSYFVASGLGVRTPETAEINAAIAGTLQHAFLEDAIDQHGKQYPNVTTDDVETFLAPRFEQLRLLYPKQVTELDLFEKRMQSVLSESIRILKDVEASTLFKPTHQEYRFKEMMTDGVLLNGIIDRIDEVNGNLRIIDYKSSEHSLSETKVKAGLQLQLLTYIIIAERLFDRNPDGVYYFSLKQTGPTVPGGKAGTKSLEFYESKDPEFLQSQTQKARRLKGWNFSSDKDPDEKDYFSGSTMDYATVQQAMEDLYTYFRDHLKTGNIDVAPVEGACTFCDYRSICRLAKEQVPATALLDYSLKGGKDNA